MEFRRCRFRADRYLQFRQETENQEWFQSVAVVNYPDPETAHTRITEYKHLTGQANPKTSITYEYPCADGDPYYPIPRSENQTLYKSYRSEEHTSELQSLMRIPYAVFCLKKKNNNSKNNR